MFSADPRYVLVDLQMKYNLVASRTFCLRVFSYIGFKGSLFELCLVGLLIGTFSGNASMTVDHSAFGKCRLDHCAKAKLHGDNFT